MKNRKRGILTIIGSSVAIFFPGALIFGFPGVMATYWKNILDVSRSTIGNTMFFVLCSVGIFMFFVGKWQERFGIRNMMLTGSIICGLSLFLILHVKSIVNLYLWAFVIGLSSCFIYIPALTAVQSWFPERKGLVSGIVNLVFGLSAAIMSPVFNHMLNSLGYKKMILFLIPVTLITGILFSLLTDASWETEKTNVNMDKSLTVLESIKTKSFWFLWCVWAFQGAAGISMVILSIPFGLSIKLKQTIAVSILTAFNITNGFSRIISGVISDKVGRNKTMAFIFFLASVAYFSLGFTKEIFAILILVAIIGFSFGTLFSVSAPLVVEVFGIKHFGVIFGAVFTGYGFVAGLIGPSLSGYLLDLTKGNFKIVFFYLGLFCLISSIFINFVKRKACEA
jgi:OFA family oxalate/formate antiporter-like MFS transporter